MSIVSWCSDKGKSNFTSNDDRYGLLINQIASKESSAGGNNYQLIVSCSLQRYKSNDCSHFIIFTEKLLGNKTESQMLWWQYLHFLSVTMQKHRIANYLLHSFIKESLFYLIHVEDLYNWKKGLVAERNKRCSNWILKKTKIGICEVYDLWETYLSEIAEFYIPYLYTE